MRRPFRALPLLALLGASLLGCGGSTDEPATQPTPGSQQTAAGESASDQPAGADVLYLRAGSRLTVPAPDRSGVVTTGTPVQLGFGSIDCADRLVGIGFDAESRNVDLVAGRNRQLCLVSVAVTNVGTRKNFFSSREISRLVTTDGTSYRVTRKTYDYQGIADEQGQQLASTSDLIAPGQTKYDYAVYEIPADAEPEAVRYQVETVG